MAKKQVFEFFFNQLVKGYRSIMGKDPEGLDLIKIKQEARQKLIDQDKVIEVQFGKPFSEEISIMDQINKSKNKIEGASNRIKKIQKEQADMYKPKSDAEIKAKFDKQNKEAVERLKNKRMLDEDEIAQLDEDIGGLEYTNDFDGTLGSANKLRKERADYIRDMELEYKKGNLDPKPGEANRERFLQKKYDEMEASGDNRLMTRDEVEELSSFDLQRDMDKSVEKFKKKDAKQKKTLKDFDPEDRDPNATGGRIGYYTGGITDVEPSLDDIGHGADAMMSRTRLMSPGSQTTTSTGLNYLLAEDNDNMRIPFGEGNTVQDKIKTMHKDFDDYRKGGGKISYKKFAAAYIPENFADGGRTGFSKGKIAKEVLDKGRRGFMKAAGATGAGIAALKTGLLGFADKAAPVVEKVAETVSETAQGVPPYFFRLVEKIKFMGDSTLATKDKANAYKFKDYVMEEDFAGNIEIIKKGEDLDGNKLEDVYMSYKIDEVPVKGKKGSAKVEDYEEFTARPDAEGKMKDIEPGIPDEVVEEAGDIDAMTLKKAEGGRIGFSKGKIAKKIIEFFGGLKKSKKLNDDEYQEFLDEVGGADQLEAYNFDGTVGDAQRIVKEQKEYMDDMFMEYKKGNLDPVAGDKSPARKNFLQNKLDEMEMSGDKRLMTTDEIEELSSFDLGSEMDVAKSLAPKMVERLQLKQKYPGITDDLLDKILIDDNVQRKAEVIATMDEALKMMEKGKGSDEIIETFKNVTRTKQAAGGLARMLGE